MGIIVAVAGVGQGTLTPFFASAALIAAASVPMSFLFWLGADDRGG